MILSEIYTLNSKWNLKVAKNIVKLIKECTPLMLEMIQESLKSNANHFINNIENVIYLLYFAINTRMECLLVFHQGLEKLKSTFPK